MKLKKICFASIVLLFATGCEASSREPEKESSLQSTVAMEEQSCRIRGFWCHGVDNGDCNDGNYIYLEDKSDSHSLQMGYGPAHRLFEGVSCVCNGEMCKIIAKEGPEILRASVRRGRLKVIYAMTDSQGAFLEPGTTFEKWEKPAN